jgi:hypothetical protein
VIIPTSKEEALAALEEIMVGKGFGAAGRFGKCLVDTVMSSLPAYRR